MMILSFFQSDLRFRMKTQATRLILENDTELDEQEMAAPINDPLFSLFGKNVIKNGCIEFFKPSIKNKA